MTETTTEFTMPRALVVFFALALLENGSAEHCIPDPNLICGTCGDRMYIAAIGGSSGATSGSAADWGVWLEDPGPSMCLALPKDDVEQGTMPKGYNENTWHKDYWQMNNSIMPAPVKLPPGQYTVIDTSGTAWPMHKTVEDIKARVMGAGRGTLHVDKHGKWRLTGGGLTLGDITLKKARAVRHVHGKGPLNYATLVFDKYEVDPSAWHHTLAAWHAATHKPLSMPGTTRRALRAGGDAQE